ncbi:MAG: hypothetical protein JWM21_888 [Acidobacteria bacterium]|nr:hypothetical protein [Acidobacteriota bacterium]
MIYYFPPKSFDNASNVCVLIFLPRFDTTNDFISVEFYLRVQGSGHSVRRILDSLNGKDAFIKSNFLWFHNITQRS